MAHRATSIGSPHPANAGARPRAEGHPAEPSFWVLAILAAAVGIITLIVFLPALRGEFLNWDDQANFLENPSYRGLHWSNLRWMFSTVYMGHYQPLTWLTLGIDYQLWGMDARGYHFTSILIHALNASLVLALAWPMLKRIGSSCPMAMRSGACVCVALLFALHPLRVESVAWITERRDVLATALLLAATLAYLKRDHAQSLNHQRAARWWLIAVYGLTALSLLAKAIGVVMPVVLLLIDMYPLKRTRRFTLWNLIAEKLPLLTLAIGIGILALWAQRTSGVPIERPLQRWDESLSMCIRSAAFYPVKTLLPLGLSPLYEVPYNFKAFDAGFARSAAIVAAISLTAIGLAWRTGHAGLLVAWCAYLVLILPVSGIFPSGPQLYADRYSYLACIPLMLWVGGATLWLDPFTRWPWRAAAVWLVTLTTSSALSVLTLRQIRPWHDSWSLWDFVLQRDPNSALAQMNRGVMLAERGDLAGAERWLRSSLQLNPINANAMSNLSSVIANQNYADPQLAHAALVEAEQLASHAVQLRPGNAVAHRNRGYALFGLGKIPEAIQAFQRSVDLSAANSLTAGVTSSKPPDWKTQAMLADLYRRNNQMDQAIAHARLAVDYAPHEPLTHQLLVELLLLAQQPNEAATALRAMCSNLPGNPEWPTRLGDVLMSVGDRVGAANAYRRALQIDAAYGPAREGLAAADSAASRPGP
jgi:Flp pilus assembly protein TadD